MEQSFIDTDNFYQYPLPKQGSKDWMYLVNSTKEFEVKGENNKLVIQHFTESNTSVLEKNSFVIECTYNGEFGGNLSIQNKNDGSIQNIIIDGFIKFVVEFNGSIYFVESLNHSWANVGVIYQLLLSNETGSFDYAKVLDLGEAPMASTVSQEKWFMVSDNNIFQIVAEGQALQKLNLLEYLPFAEFYPNSLTIIGNDFYIGLRAGYGKASLVGRDFQFFKYSHNDAKL